MATAPGSGFGLSNVNSYKSTNRVNIVPLEGIASERDVSNTVPQL